MSKNILFVSCLLFQFVYAQNVQPSISTPSPNAIAIGRFGENPVTLHNGTVGVSIPVYQLKDGDITVPIELSHHSEGARPDVHPGWAGMDWTLKAGGAITRIVKGTPDETFWKQRILFFDGSNSTFDLNYAIGHYYNNVLSNASWNQASYIESQAKRGTTYGVNGDYWQDAEPDEYAFNFNGYSGSFYFDQNKNIKVIGNPEIKIELDTLLQISYDAYNYNGFTFTYSRDNLISNISGLVSEKEYKIRGFKITTPDGIQYEFGLWHSPQTGNDPIEASINFFQQVYLGESWDTWYLKRIVSPTGHKVNFSYTSGNPIVHFNRTFAIDKASGSSTPSGIFGIFGPVSASSTSINEYFDGRIIYPTYLSSIQTTTQKIDFKISNTTELPYNYSAVLYELYNQANKTADRNITNWITPRTYAIGTSSSDPNAAFYTVAYPNEFGTGIYYREFLRFDWLQWKKLDTIRVTDLLKNNVITNTSFNYTNSTSRRLMLLSLKQFGNSTSDSAKYIFEYDTTKTLPSYNSYQTDHWGYYNGKTPSLGTLADADLNNFTNYKEPDFNFAKAGSLTKIIYPTGGYSEFIYEPNTCEKIVVRDEATGNFSLITQTKTVGGLRIKQIKNVANTGSPDNVKYYKYEGGICSGIPKYFWKNYQGKLANGNTYTSDRFVTQTIIPLSTNSIGSAIGYSKVTEQNSDSSKTENYFSNYEILDDNFVATVDIKKSLLSPFNSKQRERGMLLEKKQYKYLSPNTYQLVQWDKNNYTQAINRFNNYLPSINHGTTNVLGGTVLYGAAYKNYNYPIVLDSTTQWLYDNNNNIIKTSTQYTYGNASLLQPTQITTNNSAGNILKTQNQYPSNFTGTAVYDSMIAKNIITPVIQQNQYQDATLLTQSKTNYSLVGTKKLALPANIQSAVLSNPLETRQQFNQFDTLGNLLEMQKTNDAKEVYVWGYKNQYPVAKIIGTDYNTVIALVNQSILNQPTSDAQLQTELNKIRSNFANTNVQVITYTYGSFGITSQTDAANLTTYYEYDNIGRIAAIRDNDNNVIKTFTYKYQQ